jgi:transposase
LIALIETANGDNPNRSVRRIGASNRLRKKGCGFGVSLIPWGGEWGVAMRGDDANSGSMFSYIDLEKRVRADHPLRVIRAIANAALRSLSRDFDALYSPIGRESIPPERLMRALLLQAFYALRSERQLIERIDYDLLFRWFVGLGIDDPVWDPTSFTKNRDRLLDGEVAAKFLAAVLSHDKVRGLCRAITSRSTEPFWKPGPAPRASARRARPRAATRGTARARRPVRGATACPGEGRGRARLSWRAARRRYRSGSADFIRGARHTSIFAPVRLVIRP